MLRCLFAAASPNGSACFIPTPHSWGFEVTHNDAPQSVGLSWTRCQLVTEISTWQHTQHSQHTNVHPPGGIRTHNPSRRTAVDSLRPRGHWDRHRRQWKESLKRQKLFQNGKQEKGTKQTAMEESNVSKAMSIKLIWCEKIIIIATMQCMYSAKESNLMICMRRMEQGFMCDN
jgi:hypothetical protein